MTSPWRTLAVVGTPEGPLELRRRQNDWLMLIDGRVLMNSFSRRSEEALSQLAVDALGGAVPRRVLVSGLGMGFTLRALLDRVPPATDVLVAELNPVVVEWCRGPLAEATDEALRDPRVKVQIGDVADVIASAAAGSFDLVILDLYEGPNSATQDVEDPFYGPRALGRVHRALAPKGVLGVWSEDADVAFEKRMSANGFSTTKHAIGSGGRRHVVYLGRRR